MVSSLVNFPKVPSPRTIFAVMASNRSEIDRIFANGEILTFAGVSVNTLNAHTDFVLH